MVLKTKEENRTNAQDKPLRLRVELVHLFPLVVQKLSSLIITEFTKYKSNSLSKQAQKDCNGKPGDVAVQLLIARNEAICTKKPKRQSPKKSEI